MHIDFECSGGFANLRLTYRANTETLPSDVRQEFVQLVNDSGVFDLKQSDIVSPSTGPADVFVYQLALSEADRKQVLSLNDVTAPPSLRPLLAFLRELAIEQRKQGR
jgi:hypothetical protein